MMDDIWWQDDEEFVKSGVSIDREPDPIGFTEVGNATRAEGRENDIDRYKAEIKKAKRKKMMLRRFKDDSKIGCALGKLDEKIRFFTNMIKKTRRVGSYDYPKIYDKTRALIVDLAGDYSDGQLAREVGCSRSIITDLHSKQYREVSKHTAHNIYEVLLGVKRREDAS